MLRRTLAVPSTVADFTLGTIIVLFQVGVRNRTRAWSAGAFEKL